MNFLAHLYLSGSDDDLKIGNFIADHIKGKTIYNLPPGIMRGVLLHRKIDHFTDHHPVVMRSKERLRPSFRKYAPVIADIFYDHFLAINWDAYSDISLEKYSRDFYSLANANLHHFPERTKHMLPYMINNDWLVSYATVNGIHKVLTGMSRRTNFDSGMERAAEELQLNYTSYESEFRIFFKDLEAYVSKETEQILS